MTDAPRDVAWYRLLMSWLDTALKAENVDRLGLRGTPLKLLRYHDSPGPGHTTVTSFEFSDQRWQGPDVEVGYEILFASRAEVDGLTAIRRATETLDALERPPQPGLVLLDALTGVDGLPPSMRHGMFVPPWAHDGPDPLEADGVRVEAMALVPVPEDEVELVRRSGFEELARRWEREMAPLLDPGRPSVA